MLIGEILVATPLLVDKINNEFNVEPEDLILAFSEHENSMEPQTSQRYFTEKQQNEELAMELKQRAERAEMEQHHLNQVSNQSDMGGHRFESLSATELDINDRIQSRDS